MRCHLFVEMSVEVLFSPLPLLHLEHNPDLFQLKTAPELLKSPRVSAAIIDAERKRDAQQVAEGPRDAPGLE